MAAQVRRSKRKVYLGDELEGKGGRRHRRRVGRLRAYAWRQQRQRPLNETILMRPNCLASSKRRFYQPRQRHKRKFERHRNHENSRRLTLTMKPAGTPMMAPSRP